MIVSDPKKAIDDRYFLNETRVWTSLMKLVNEIIVDGTALLRILR